MAKRRREEFVEIIKSVPMFAGLTKRQLNDVARLCFEVEYAPGDVILKDGERDAQHLAAITKGTARVVRRGKDVATVGPGDVVGEMSLIDGLPRSAAVIAETPVEAIVLYGTAFHALIDDAPSMCWRLLVAQTTRIREFDERLRLIG